MNQKLIRKALGASLFSIVTSTLSAVAWADGCDLSQGVPCVVDPVVISVGCGAGCVGTTIGVVGLGNITPSGNPGQTITLPPLPPGQNTRKTPACLGEQYAQAEVASFLMAGGNPFSARQSNGIYNYTELAQFRGTMAYPSGIMWTKFQRNFIIDGTSSVVSIHFEWNMLLGQFTYPPHFNNTPAQGCGGT